MSGNLNPHYISKTVSLQGLSDERLREGDLLQVKQHQTQQPGLKSPLLDLTWVGKQLFVGVWRDGGEGRAGCDRRLRCAMPNQQQE